MALIDSAQIAILKRLLELGDDMAFERDLRERGDEKAAEWADLRGQLKKLPGPLEGY